MHKAARLPDFRGRLNAEQSFAKLSELLRKFRRARSGGEASVGPV